MEAGNEEDSMTMMRLGTEEGRLVTQPFSASSRETREEQGAYEDISAYIQSAHLQSSHASLVVRVLVQDVRNGAVREIGVSLMLLLLPSLEKPLLSMQTLTSPFLPSTGGTDVSLRENDGA